MKDGSNRKVRDAVLRHADNAARQCQGRYCRWWVCQEKVPKALLEEEVKNR